MINHYVTKRRRRPRNKRREDYTAQTMATLKKHAVEDETLLPFVRLSWTKEETENFNRLLDQAAANQGPPKDVEAWAKKIADEASKLND